MNDATTTQATSLAQSDADALVARQLNHVGAAYALVFVVVLAFNFLGDGLRDAADPYS